MAVRSWSVTPLASTYWLRKEQFLLDRDTSDYWTMFAVEEGRFAYRIGEREGEAGFGDIVVCPPGVTFERRTLTALTFFAVHFAWEDEPVEEERTRLSGAIAIAGTERLASTYRYMRAIGRDWALEPAFGRMKHMLDDIWRLAELELELQLQSERSGAAGEARQEPDPDMRRARQWLQTRAYEPFAMRELADWLGLTPVQLTRRFRAAYRTTPSAYVADLRIDRACRLLEETALPLEAIAQRCGYDNGFYLSRVFRRRKGATPSAYRKLHRV